MASVDPVPTMWISIACVAMTASNVNSAKRATSAWIDNASAVRTDLEEIVSHVQLVAVRSARRASSSATASAKSAALSKTARIASAMKRGASSAKMVSILTKASARDVRKPYQAARYVDQQINASPASVTISTLTVVSASAVKRDATKLQTHLPVHVSVRMATI